MVLLLKFFWLNLDIYSSLMDIIILLLPLDTSCSAALSILKAFFRA